MNNFLIAPDFPPQHFAGWHLLNTYFQRHSDLSVHLLTPSTAIEQHELVSQDTVDLIYANPFDASELVRNLGYMPVAKPINKSDEMVIASATKSDLKKFSDLKPGSKVARTKNKDINLIGLRLLEAVDLTEDDLEWIEAGSFQAAARMVIKQEADAAFFVASAYHSLSRLTLQELNPLMESHLNDVIHVILAHPRRSAQLDIYKKTFIEMNQNEQGQRILTELNMPKGFSELTEEETEFMIDLMDTLLD